MSPHLASASTRALRRARSLATGAPYDDAAPIAERDPNDAGTYGAHCGLGDVGFSKWTCAGGLACTVVESTSDDADVGSCVPSSAVAGDPCELGVVSADANGYKDHVVSKSARDCGATRFCETNYAGFPDGMCASPCAALDATSVCAGVPILTAFNDCLAKKTPFEACIAEHAEPKGVRACAIDRPCRDDYVCARTPEGKGACMPPYFLFQLRVDGHPG
jgi:hypothetical protein